MSLPILRLKEEVGFSYLPTLPGLERLVQMICTTFYLDEDGSGKVWPRMLEEKTLSRVARLVYFSVCCSGSFPTDESIKDAFENLNQMRHDWIRFINQQLREIHNREAGRV